MNRPRPAICKKSMRLIDQSNFVSGVEMSTAFSPKLQEFINKNPEMTRVFVDPDTRRWYIGYKDGVIWAGALFTAAICQGKRLQAYSLGREITDRFQDRTKQFWKCTAHFGSRMLKSWYW